MKCTSIERGKYEFNSKFLMKNAISAIYSSSLLILNKIYTWAHW